MTDNLDVWTSAIASKATAGRSSDKQTAYGIKKLRELILELAVRGKLVPQDPNDEPANELLKRIQTKKPKTLSELTLEDYSFQLPAGWVNVSFGNIFFLEYGDNLPAEKRSNTGEYPVYGSNGIVGSHNECFVKSPCIVVGRKGSAGALNLSLTPGCCVTDVAYYCIPPNALDLNYVFKLFQTLKLDSLGKGIKPGLNRNEAYLLQVSIPPLAEQHRIVAKVDELMALCDQMEQQQTDHIAAHQTLVQTLLDTLSQAADAMEFEQAWSRIADHFDTLFTTESSIDQLKQTLLQLAVMGKLVPQDPDDEPACELLTKIAKEHGKTGKGRTAKNKPEMDLSQKANLPVGWEVALFQDITKVITCGMASTPKYYDSGRIFLSAKNVKPYRFMPDDHKFVDEETYRKITQNAKPEKGDILLTRVGAGIGEAALIDQDIDFAYYVSLTLIKPYLRYFRNGN